MASVALARMVVAYIVMAYIVMASIAMARIVAAHIVMACTGTAYIVVAYVGCVESFAIGSDDLSNKYGKASACSSLSRHARSQLVHAKLG